jgi:hypothetical protein
MSLYRVEVNLLGLVGVMGLKEIVAEPNPAEELE